MVKLSSSEVRVGLFVFTVLTFIGGLSLKLSESPSLLAATRRHYFDIGDAGGLVKNGVVKMAGVKIGVIESIELVDGKARVFLAIDKNTPITTASQIVLRADGILGDKYVEVLTPVHTTGQPLKSGQPIPPILDADSSFEDLTRSVNQITESLEAVVSQLQSAFRGEDETSLGRIITNVEQLTENLANISSHRQEMYGIINRVQSITHRLDEIVNSNIVDSVDVSLRNIEEVTEKINKGDGTIGQLINDKETISGINEAVGGVNDLLGGFRRMEIGLDVHSAYLLDRESRTTAFVKIVPGLDRHYELGVTSSPQGEEVVHVERKTYSGGLTTEVETSRRRKNDLTFRALFAKSFHNWTFKGGMIQSSGGLGVDYYLMRRKLRLSFEAFRFHELDWKFFARYDFSNGFYLIGGGDSLFTSQKRSAFLGLGIFLTNDDLKLFVPQIF